MDWVFVFSDDVSLAFGVGEFEDWFDEFKLAGTKLSEQTGVSPEPHRKGHPPGLSVDLLLLHSDSFAYVPV